MVVRFNFNIIIPSAASSKFRQYQSTNKGLNYYQKVIKTTFLTKNPDYSAAAIQV